MSENECWLCGDEIDEDSDYVIGGDGYCLCEQCDDELDSDGEFAGLHEADTPDDYEELKS